MNSSFDFTGVRDFPVDGERQKHSQIHPSVLKRMQLVKGYKPHAHLPQNWGVLVADEPLITV
jgi:hypothetical protein